MKGEEIRFLPFFGDNTMDIGSSRSYPAGTLSNFSPHPFVLDGVHCASMEGFLQSLKFKSPEMQEQVCGLVGLAAKRAGRKKKWFRTQTLYWRGRELKRDSEEYQNLLNRAYNALNGNSSFRKALLATGKHRENQGNRSSRLMHLRDVGEPKENPEHLDCFM